jgi:preprotein translocase subunit SecB
MNDSSQANTDNAQPHINVLVQYTKDLSFENPHAPKSLAPQNEQPEISIQVNINARPLSAEEFEVELILEGSARNSEITLFKFDLTYSGLFRLAHVPEKDIQPIVMIECPRLLFPFARQIIAECVRNGGFPPLYLDPIDFVALYQQRIAQTAENALN